ncbi:MAG: hypothetical protein ABI207_03340 [Crocinitomicaceae bacterium]
MGLFNIFKIKKKTAGLNTKPISTLGRAKKHTYIAEINIIYNGKKLRRFEASEDGFSRSNVRTKMNQGFSLSVGRVYRKR